MARALSLAEAVDLTRTGDIWVFRGRSTADRLIQVSTNSPVNHVGMALVLDDLPPLMWHAELGRSLVDIWSGKRQRGVQLHDLADAVRTWTGRYGQAAWMRQLDPGADRDMEDAALRVVARLDGTPFPSTVAMASRWVGGRVPRPPRPPRVRWPRLRRRAGSDGPVASPEGMASEDAVGVMDEPVGDTAAERGSPNRSVTLETAYCAEVVALTYIEMGLLPGDRSPSWYDPGHFWSGDRLHLQAGRRLGPEIPVDVPVDPAATGR